MILWLISYSELTEKFIYYFEKTYNVSYEEVIEFIKNSDYYVLASYIQEFWSIYPTKEAYKYAEIIKEDVISNPKGKNSPSINVSYIGCGSTTQRWQWGNDNGGPACTGANRCWGTILNGNYLANMEDTLYSPTINASGYNNIVLRFRQWYYTETNFDQGFVLCSPNGGNNWYLVAGPIQGNSNVWINTTLSLPSQCQNTSQLRIAFRFKSDGSIQYYGWYIDDVVVENQNLLGTTILYSSSFEGNDGDLSIVNIGSPAPWQRGTPTSGPNLAYHGQEVWATNLSGNYNNNADQAIEKQAQINLSCPGCNNYFLRFYHYVHTETGYDSGWVELNTGAGWFNFSPSYRGNGASGPLTPSWTLVQLDLTPYANQNLRFRFRFKSDGSINYSGWYIDSVSVIGTNITSTTIASYDFNANDGGWTATQALNISDPYQLSNNFLEWYVDILSANDLGTYTARTGPSHPFGIISVLFGAQFSPISAWSSWTTIRSNATNIDYITKNGSATAPAPYTSAQLKPYATTVICEQNVPRLTIIYNVNANGDNFTAKEIFWITGNDANSSRLWHRTVIINNASNTRFYGVRWQYDTHVGNTDHPAHFQCDYYPVLNLSCGPQITTEQTVNPITNTFDFLRESDTDPPTRYHLFSVYADGGSQTGITPPDFVQHIRWGDAHNYTWDQGVNGENISLSTGFDNAFNYFFNPRPVAPNDSISFTGLIGSPINPTPINSNELNISGSRIKVYNVKNGFNIYYEGDKEISIAIYDIKGSIVKKTKIYKGNNFVEIRNKGIYIIKTDSYTLRIIK